MACGVLCRAPKSAAVFLNEGKGEAMRRMKRGFTVVFLVGILSGAGIVPTMQPVAVAAPRAARGFVANTGFSQAPSRRGSVGHVVHRAASHVQSGLDMKLLLSVGLARKYLSTRTGVCGAHCWSDVHSDRFARGTTWTKTLQTPALLKPSLLALRRSKPEQVSGVAGLQSLAALELPASAFPTDAQIDISGDLPNADSDSTDTDWFRGNHSATYTSLGRSDGYYEEARWSPPGSGGDIYLHYQASVFASAIGAASANSDGVTFSEATAGAAHADCGLQIPGCTLVAYSSTVSNVPYQEIYASFSVNNVLVEISGDILPSASQLARDAYDQALNTLISTAYTTVVAATGGQPDTSPTTTPIASATSATSTAPTSTPSAVPTPSPVSPVSTPTPVTPAQITISSLQTLDRGNQSSSVYYRNPTQLQLRYTETGITSGERGQVVFVISSHIGKLLSYTDPITVQAQGSVRVEVGGAITPGRKRLQATITFGATHASTSSTFTVFDPGGFRLFPNSQVAPLRHTFAARMESNQTAQHEGGVLHLDRRSFAQEGRQTGYFESFGLAWPSLGKRAVVLQNDLVSIYGSPQQAQSAFYAQRNGYDSVITCGSCKFKTVAIARSKVGIGDCCSAIYATSERSGFQEDEVFFVRAKVLVQVWTSLAHPLNRKAATRSVLAQFGASKALDAVASEQQSF